MGERVGRVLAEAYSKASSKEDVDDEVEALKKAGVILPNGFTPMPPLFHKAGEDIVNFFNP